MKNYTITVNGNAYDVTVEENGAAQAAPVSAPKAAPKAAPAAAPKAAAPAGAAPAARPAVQRRSPPNTSRRQPGLPCAGNPAG